MAKRTRRPSGFRRTLSWAFAWAAAAGLWLLLVAKISLEELVGAAVGATLACAGVAVFQNADRTAFHPTAHMLLQAWRVPGDLLSGAWIVFRGLGRGMLGLGKPAGVLRSVKLDMGPENDPRADARRALTITFTTLTPNTVVVGFVPSQKLMLYHQFAPTGDLPIAESLECCE